ncbi:TLC domain-containing protein 2 [Toxocara canis]|uniref:TLC domain-containing protein 2 n=1 Tax=Toxocara canis TaxID=6265 RepID=A0A0B2VBN1_TOXCA|nr:TLC domain-containing protein 2 [Toxocara canis]
MVWSNVEILIVFTVTVSLRMLYLLANSLVKSTMSNWSYDKRRVFVVRLVSFTHALVSGVCTIFGIEPNATVGYFIHDLIDMIVYGEALRSKEYIIHHSFSVAGFISILSSGYLLGIATICLLAEVQTAFLHARTIFRLLGFDPTNSSFYGAIMRCNLVALILCRHIPTVYLLGYLIFIEDRAYFVLKIFLLMGLSFLFYHNCHLQYRFLKTDGYLGDEIDYLDEHHVDPLDSDPKKKKVTSDKLK